MRFAPRPRRRGCFGPKLGYNIGKRPVVRGCAFVPNWALWFLQLKSGLSPMWEFAFLAACARSEGNAASAKDSVLPRSGKTSHSRRVERGSKVEVTDGWTKPT